METEELLSAPQTFWWHGFGSPPLTTESLSGEASDSFPGVKVVTPETEQGVDKQSSATLFTFSSGGGKSSIEEPNPHVAFQMQSACFEFGFSQPKIFTKHPHMEQYYGVVSAYESQRSLGRIMLPLKMESEEDGTIYVNSKQYNAIIRRRLSRAKVVLKNKPNNLRKPYMHHSRHLHAMRRPRGSGGRFLNTKKADDAAKHSKPSNSQNSEVFHPEIRTMNSSMEANRVNVLGSEVTSTDYFLTSSIHPLDHGKWVAAGCCNLKT